MNILRKAAVTASSAVLLTAVGAITGIGSLSAQAETIDASPEVVAVHLTAADTTRLAASDDEVFTMCSMLDGRTTMISFFRPPTQGACEVPLSKCAHLAAGHPATIRFYWFSPTTCEF